VELHYGFDTEFMARYLERWPNVTYVDRDFVKFRLHERSKSMFEEGRLFAEERPEMLATLPRKLESTRLRKECERVRNKILWHGRINALRQSLQPKHKTALLLLRETLRDPFHRLDRFTVGAFRRLVASGNEHGPSMHKG
jgi:hypothetical protein